jgi:hypothetical protein
MMSEQTEVAGEPSPEASHGLKLLSNRVLDVTRHASGQLIVVSSIVVAIVGFLAVDRLSHYDHYNPIFSTIRYGEIEITPRCETEWEVEQRESTCRPSLKPRSLFDLPKSKPPISFDLSTVTPPPSGNTFDRHDQKSGSAKHSELTAIERLLLCEPQKTWWCEWLLPYRWLLSMCVIFAGIGFVRWRPGRSINRKA